MAHNITLTDQQATFLQLIVRFPLASFVHRAGDDAIVRALLARGLYRHVASIKPRRFDGMLSNAWFELTPAGEQALCAYLRPQRLADARQRAAPELVALLEGVIDRFGVAVEQDFDIPGTDAVEFVCGLVRRARALLSRIEQEAD